jgi:hypothetical protein
MDSANAWSGDLFHLLYVEIIEYPHGGLVSDRFQYFLQVADTAVD